MSTLLGTDSDFIRYLIENYNTPVPRYTSYPTALEWHPDFDERLYFDALAGMSPDRQVSVYIHLPFCENLCLYCGCNVLVSRKRELADEYLESLFQEIRHKLKHLQYTRPRLQQLHFGGGTPNYLTTAAWSKLMGFLREEFDFSATGEFSVELDPMVLSPDYLEHLRMLGFNRVSYGIQDVNPATLEAVDRPQDISHLDRILSASGELGFDSVNTDFIYGLPYQSVHSFVANTDFILRHRPDRIAMFSYAHVPWLKHHQNRMPLDAIPGPEAKLRIYLEARERLLSGGYRQIGMDHFALADDSLSVALDQKSLHRNFMGYSTQAELDLLAFGSSSIAKIGPVFAQNHLKLKAYSAAAASGKGWFEKGILVDEDDLLRAQIIQRLMGSMYLNYADAGYSGDEFRNKYARELQNLESFAGVGLVKISADSIQVTEPGLFVVRHIAAVFDRHRNKDAAAGFSRGI